MFTFQIPPEIVSVDAALLLRFKLDDTINANGFSAAYVLIVEVVNFDYTTFEASASLQNNYERKPPAQKSYTFT